MCYIELKNEKYETLEDLKRLLHYILRLDKTAEDSQRANTITNTLAGCHFAVCAVSFQTQNMFHIQWKSEWKMLVTVTNQWKSEFDELLQNNIQMRQSREAALYGDDIVRYGSISVTAKGQMIQNKKSKRK